MATTQLYHLEIFGGNAAINNKSLSQDALGNLVARTDSQQPPALISYTPGSGLISVHKQEEQPPNPNSNADEKDDNSLILSGPSGKGESQLGVSANPREYEHLIGSETFYRDWEVVDSGSNLWLRYADPTGSSHWVAVPEGEGDDAVWSQWWFSPNAANMDDLEGYVSVDLRLVPAGGGGRDEL